MTASTRTVIRPHLLLDVVTGELLADRAVVIEGHRIAGVVGAGIYPHGLNARQFAYQVRCGQSPLGAIQSATIHAAELIRWDDRAGRIAPGYFADLIAVDGDPLQDIRLLENAVFVIKDGAIQLSGGESRRSRSQEPRRN